MSALAAAVTRRVGERVRTLRQSRGLTQRGLAQRTGLSRPTIANVEAGRQTVTVRHLCALAEALDVSLETLLSG